MRVQITRPRMIAAAAAGLALLALILGVAFPPDSPNAGALSVPSAPAPALLVSEFDDAASRLWLVDPADPASREPWLTVDHAPGWDVSGAVSPGGDALAFVALTPGRRDATTEATLLLSDGGPPRILADGVDLRGGVVWTADGRGVLVRRTAVGAQGQPAFTVVEVRLADGREFVRLRRDDVAALHVVGWPAEGPLYVTLIGPWGSELLALHGAEDESVLLSTGVTRDWRLSPDGTQLAFTEQRGTAMQVRVVSLLGDGAPLPAMVAATSDAQARWEANPGAVATASPAWQPDGTLSVGVFAAPAPAAELRAASLAAGEGFALPLWWSPDGRHLAVRAFDGAGPGSSTREDAAVVGPDGAATPIPGRHLQVLGWWHASP